MKRHNVSDEAFKEAVSKSKSYSEVCRTLGIPDKGGNLRVARNRIERLGLDISHFTGQLWSKGLHAGDHPSIKARDIYDYLVLDGPRIHTNTLKHKLYRAGLKHPVCECCGISEWNGKPITCQLHHINGNWRDNRLENLQILCPNCHSQTDNYSGKKNHDDKQLSKTTDLSAQDENPDVEAG